MEQFYDRWVTQIRGLQHFSLALRGAGYRQLSVGEGGPEREAHIDKGAAADIDARATDLAIIDRERAQATDPHRTLQPKWPLEAHGPAKAKIKPAQIEAHFAGAAVDRPAIARVLGAE
jgi:hypothetical protein